MKYITCFCVYEKEDKRAVDLALITAKQVFELFILILSGVVIGKIKMARVCFLTFLYISLFHS